MKTFYYVLSQAAMAKTKSIAPVYETTSKERLDQWLDVHWDSINDLLIGLWYMEGDKVLVGSTYPAQHWTGM